MQIMKKKKKKVMDLSDEEDEEEKEEEKDTSNKKVDDSKVNKIKHEVKSIPCRTQKLQKPISAKALLEKGARNAFEAVEKFWYEKC